LSDNIFQFGRIAPMSMDPVWRNIYTIQYSENLFDDLVSPGREKILYSLDHATSAIDHSVPGKYRVFQYGDANETIACFDPKYYAESRFSRGNFGVFYGAMDEKTSVAEIMAMHQRRFETNMAAAAEPVIIDRKMFNCKLIGTRCTDIRPLIEVYPDIIADRHEFCHIIGDEARALSLDFLVTESVRRPSGLCVAAFNADCVVGEKFQYFFQLVYTKDGQPEANKITRIEL